MRVLLYIPNRFLRYVGRCVCAPWRKCLINSIVQSKQYNKGRRRFWPSLSRSEERNVIFIRNSFGGITDWFKGMVSLLHIGFSESVTELGITKSYAEFMLISMAAKAYQVKDDLMYESKFPKWATTINSVPYSIIRNHPS